MPSLSSSIKSNIFSEMNLPDYMLIIPKDFMKSFLCNSGLLCVSLRNL